MDDREWYNKNKNKLFEGLFIECLILGTATGFVIGGVDGMFYGWCIGMLIGGVHAGIVIKRRLGIKLEMLEIMDQQSIHAYNNETDKAAAPSEKRVQHKIQSENQMYGGTSYQKNKSDSAGFQIPVGGMAGGFIGLAIGGPIGMGVGGVIGTVAGTVHAIYMSGWFSSSGKNC